jgi:enterobactin synthetase component D
MPREPVAPWSLVLADPAELAFDLRLEHGRCVGVRLPLLDAPDAMDRIAESQLYPEERTFASSLPTPRRRTWVGGRAAMRHALARLGTTAPAVLVDERGAPILPPGIVGSISHKESLAVALVARSPAGVREHVGVDLEIEASRSDRPDIGPKILTDDEAAELSELDPIARAREVLLRFSAKEAIYKALDPLVRRYVGFKEVAVKPLPGGMAEVVAHLPPTEGPFAIEVRWMRWEGFVLTTARVQAL